MEVCDPSDVDLAHFFIGPDDGSLSFGIPPGSVYGFVPMTVAQLNGFLACGRVELANELARRGLGQPGTCGGAPFELIIRRKQLLAEAYSCGGSTPSYAGADDFMGTSYRPGGAIVGQSSQSMLRIACTKNHRY